MTLNPCGLFCVVLEKGRKQTEELVDERKKNKKYHIYHMYTDRQASANSVDPDEMPQKAASHQDLHCLRLVQQFLETTSGSKLYLFKF